METPHRILTMTDGGASDVPQWSGRCSRFTPSTRDQWQLDDGHVLLKKIIAVRNINGIVEKLLLTQKSGKNHRFPLLEEGAQIRAWALALIT